MGGRGVRNFFHLADGGKKLVFMQWRGCKDLFFPPKVIFNIFNSNTNKQFKATFKHVKGQKFQKKLGGIFYKKSLLFLDLFLNIFRGCRHIGSRMGGV